MPVRVRLLGPVDVVADGAPLPVRGVRRKAVLATLALRAGEVVGIDRLTGAVWGEAAPATAVNTLQSHVSYLRGVLGSKAAILARPPGYVLDVGAEGTDVRVAERLLRRGEELADPAQRVRHLRAALELWRGPPLADLAGLAWLEEQAGQLDLLRTQVKYALSDAMLAAGDHVRLVPGLAEMAAEHPLDERVHAQLMLALYRSGRQADALAVYHRLRRTLDDELGIGPGRPLRDLETAILQQDPVLNAPVPASDVTRAQVPRQLPPSAPGFTGRGAELGMLGDVLLGGNPVAVISGTAGVGKTALAVHWARQVASRFPGGQLYVNLRGFDPDDRALDPDDVLCGFLAAFGVARYPGDLAGHYRSLLAGKRVLVVLDNARDAEQVRPLLPGSPGCLVIVTSRCQLTGLVAVDGAIPVGLDLLTAADARDLLARRIGADRVAAEPDAAQAIITGCARLPLAVTIAAARATANPGFPLAVLAKELRAETRALDAFDGGDLATNVRTLFSWSYRALSTGAARLFRLLGLHPGHDVTLDAAASLAALPTDRARALITELTRAHLLAEPSPGRYGSHDLLRAYAAELAAAHDSEQDRDAAARRMLDHYLHTAHGAALARQPYLDPIPLPAARPGVVVAQLATARDALRWLAEERGNVLAAVQFAADARLDATTWQLAWSISNFLLREGRWTDQAKAWQTALAAARRAGDPAGEAHALYGLGEGYRKSGRHRAAEPLLWQALRAFEAAGGHLDSQASVHNSLTCLAEANQRPSDMLSHALRARELYQAAAHPAGQVWVLNNIGACYAGLGDYRRAKIFCERALAGTRELGERNWESASWDSLGHIHHRLGDHRQAVACYERSVRLCRETGDRCCEAHSLEHLGDVQHGAGDIAAARRTWADALRILDEIHHPGGDRIRARLR